MSVNLWSMRTNVVTDVDRVGHVLNHVSVAVVGLGMMPEFRYKHRVRIEQLMGMVLFGNGCPGVRPSDASLRVVRRVAQCRHNQLLCCWQIAGARYARSVPAVGTSGVGQCRVVGSSGAGQNLAPLFVPEEERLLLVGVVDLGNVQRSANVEAVDVVVDVGQRPR